MGNGGRDAGMAGGFMVPGYGVCTVTEKGYPRIVSGPLRGLYLHRAVWERTAGRKVPEGFHVHHMNGKMDWAPGSLIALEACLHYGPEPRRDPYTGEFLSRTEFEKRYL